MELAWLWLAEMIIVLVGHTRYRSRYGRGAALNANLWSNMSCYVQCQFQR